VRIVRAAMSAHARYHVTVNTCVLGIFVTGALLTPSGFGRVSAPYRPAMQKQFWAESVSQKQNECFQNNTDKIHIEVAIFFCFKLREKNLPKGCKAQTLKIETEKI
jgi:hypothetical protein